jgi:3-deoxy-D-manno-octulosonate 8-phosphate phosphatase (KDO 8-P phosphatase)
MTLPTEVARRVRLLILDADGVLTDGGIYVADGDGGGHFELRRFSVHDGIAMFMLRQAGIGIAIVSSKVSVAVRERARDLGIDEVHQVDPYHKLETVEAILERHGCTWEEAAYLGDDLPDLPVLRHVGLPAAVCNAAPEVRDAAAWCSTVPGGAGAVRELVETILRTRDEWTPIVEAFVEECEARWRG